MSVKIECIISDPDRETVREKLEKLSGLMSRLEDIDIETGNIEKRSGFHEELHIGALLLTIISPIAVGLATNAIWAWIQSMNGKLKTDVIKDPGKPVKIEIGTVKIVISMHNSSEDKK